MGVPLTAEVCYRNSTTNLQCVKPALGWIHSSLVLHFGLRFVILLTSAGKSCNQSHAFFQTDIILPNHKSRTRKMTAVLDPSHDGHQRAPNEPLLTIIGSIGFRSGFTGKNGAAREASNTDVNRT